MNRIYANNVYFDIPELMNDGRMTNYKPNAFLNNQVLKQEHAMCDAEYRTYLQKNADSVILKNQLHVNQNVATQKLSNTQIENTNELGPHIYASVNDTTKPFGYKESDLKEMYLTRTQLQSRLYTPIADIGSKVKNTYLK